MNSFGLKVALLAGACFYMANADCRIPKKESGFFVGRKAVIRPGRSVPEGANIRFRCNTGFFIYTPDFVAKPFAKVRCMGGELTPENVAAFECLNSPPVIGPKPPVAAPPACTVPLITGGYLETLDGKSAVVGSKIPYNRELFLVCHHGVATGSDVTVCGLKGWTAFGRCRIPAEVDTKPIGCKVPIVEHGFLVSAVKRYPVDTIVPLGTTLKLACEIGHRVVGTRTITCEDVDKWSYFTGCSKIKLTTSGSTGPRPTPFPWYERDIVRIPEDDIYYDIPHRPIIKIGVKSLDEDEEVALVVDNKSSNIQLSALLTISVMALALLI